MHRFYSSLPALRSLGKKLVNVPNYEHLFNCLNQLLIRQNFYYIFYPNLFEFIFKQLLCLLLQTIALIALNPSTHRHFIEMQVDNPLIQMLLPADDWL